MFVYFLIRDLFIYYFQMISQTSLRDIQIRYNSSGSYYSKTHSQPSQPDNQKITVEVCCEFVSALVFKLTWIKKPVYHVLVSYVRSTNDQITRMKLNEKERWGYIRVWVFYDLGCCTKRNHSIRFADGTAGIGFMIRTVLPVCWMVEWCFSNSQLQSRRNSGVSDWWP